MFLEIVIPTYNRSHILVSTIREVIAAISTQDEEIGLRVIDNCSTDATTSILKPYADQSLLTYERNSANIGAARNIAKCVSSSCAQWVWVFGDDDHILIHSLKYLISALRLLRRDIVFARALSLKVSSDGSVSYLERRVGSSNDLITLYDPGVKIACHGTIHDLAFISQLIINPSCWNQAFHDKIYSPTDLYTFVLTLMNECLTKQAADINIHISAATDRGDRDYYIPNVCISRLTEFTSYETIVHAGLGSRRARKILAAGRKSIWRHRIASIFKLLSNEDSCKIGGKDPIAYMLDYQSPYLEDVIVVRAFALVAKFPMAKATLKRVYGFLSRRSS